MSAPTYVVEVRSGNPSLLLLQSNGTYKSIAHGHGDDSLDDLIILAESANQWEAS